MRAEWAKRVRAALAYGGSILLSLSCGGVAEDEGGQDWEMQSRDFGFPPPVSIRPPPDITTTSCGRIDLGRPQPSPLHAQVTNDAPAKFPPGTTRVTWRAQTSGGSATATQRVTVILGEDAACCPAWSVVRRGTSNDDRIIGTSGSDCILASGGQDVIDGAGGDDYISTGDGEDVVAGGDGVDVLFGGTAGDSLYGDSGIDQIFGGEGDDRIYGNGGDDVISGGNGQDLVFGGPGNDTLIGEAGDDTLDGGPGNDRMVGSGLHDTCIGDGADTFEQCETRRLPVLPSGKDFDPAEVDEVVNELRRLDPLEIRIVLPAFDNDGDIVGTRTIGSLPLIDVRQVSKVRNVIFDGDGNLQTIFTIFADNGCSGGGAGSHVESRSSGRDVALRLEQILQNVDRSRFVFLLN